MAVTDAQEPEQQGRPHDELKRFFSQSDDAHEGARKLARRDRKWYDNYDNSQWDESEKAVLKSRGQPIVTSNYIKRKINFLRGFEQRGRSDPKGLPRKPGDEQAANVVTDVLDYVETNIELDQTFSHCFFDACWSGIEAVEVVWNGDEIDAQRIDPEKFFYDPRSKEQNFSDARWMGYSDWHDLEEAVALFPDHAEELEAAVDEGEVFDEGHEDKPLVWTDRSRKRVRIVVCYYQVGKDEWRLAYFTGANVLYDEPSPYLNADGEPECAIKAQSAYVAGVEGERAYMRYGVIRDMIGPQMEVNYRRSLSLFLLKNRRMWAQKGVFENPSNTKEEVAKADGLVIANGVYGQAWGFIDSSAEIAGNFELLTEAKSVLDAQGPNAGLQGRGTEDQSGRAIIAQQQAGLTEENLMFDAHNAFKLRVYRALWARVRQFWTEQKYIRITEDENSYRFVALNEPEMMMDPMTGQPVPTGRVNNSLAELDADIIIEAAPDSVTLQHEQFEMLANIIPQLIQLPVPYAIMMVQASQLQNKAEIIEGLKEMAANPMAQMQAEMEMQGKKAEIELNQARTVKERSQAMENLTDAAAKAADASVPHYQPGQPGF